MPSNAILEQKKQTVSDLAELLRNSPAGVLVNYSGITVEDDTKLRAALRKAGVKYMVMKNTLTGRACEEVGLGEMKQYLSGMTAIAISENDAVAPAKVMKEYAEKIESFEILAGYLEGAVVDKNTVISLADIPSKEVLIGKILGSLQSPLYGLAYVLQGKIDKEGGEAPAEEASAAAEAAEA
ncbi:MAG: 50S ribosomal protein L10 [Clostridia bacterium]|nr:50S ribosomal protein L10 [Clostridia bacterium]